MQCNNVRHRCYLENETTVHILLIWIGMKRRNHIQYLFVINQYVTRWNANGLYTMNMSFSIYTKFQSSKIHMKQFFTLFFVIIVFKCQASLSLREDIFKLRNLFPIQLFIMNNKICLNYLLVITLCQLIFSTIFE